MRIAILRIRAAEEKMRGQYYGSRNGFPCSGRNRSTSRKITQSAYDRQSTFKATLNGADVTNRFSVVDANRRRAVFEAVAGSPLTLGKNTLTTSVDGTVPGSNRKATHNDRVVFLAQ